MFYSQTARSVILGHRQSERQTDRQTEIADRDSEWGRCGGGGGHKERWIETETKKETGKEKDRKNDREGETHTKRDK